MTRRRRQDGVVCVGGGGMGTVTTGHTAGSFYEYTARLALVFLAVAHWKV